MRLGLWGARADAGGLANMTHEFWRHLHPDKTFVIDLGERGRGPADRTRYPGATFCEGMDDHITDTVIDTFCDGLDVVYAAETFYCHQFAERARSADVRTVLHAMPELVRADYTQPDVMWLPTCWEAHRLPDAPIVPVPVARERLPYRARTEAATFLHVAAPAFHDRQGTKLVLAALRHLSRPTRVIIRASRRRDLPAMAGRSLPRHVDVDIQVGTDPDYWAAYPAEADVLLLPRRYAGLSLPAQEAASLGMGVVMLDLPPYNTVLPPEALIAARPRQQVRMAGGTFTVHDADPRALAAKMDELTADPALVERLSKESDRLADSISWDRWASEYRRLFEEIVSA